MAGEPWALTGGQGGSSVARAHRIVEPRKDMQSKAAVQACRSRRVHCLRVLSRRWT